MSSEALKEFAKSPAPGFRCYAAGDKSGRRFLARVCHVLHRPASSASITRIRQMLGRYAEKVVAFYTLHDGFVLYQDTLSDAAGIELFPVEQWDEATQDMRSCFEFLAEEPESDPDHIVTGIAIATVPHSGNYFVTPTRLDLKDDDCCKVVSPEIVVQQWPQSKAVHAARFSGSPIPVAVIGVSINDISVEATKQFAILPADIVAGLSRK